MPLHAQALERVLDGLVGVHQAQRLVAGVLLGLVVGRVEDVLRAGGRGVAVLEDQQHRVVAVEQRALHAGQQPVVPEAAVAHDGQHPSAHVRRHPRAAGQAHAIAQDGVAGGKRLEGGEGVAADVGRHMQRAHRLLRQLDGREHRPLRAADAKARRAGGQRRGQAFRHLGAALRLPSSQACTDAVSNCGSTWFSQAARPAAITSTVYSPPMGSRSLPCRGVWMSRRRSSVAISCSMYSGWPFFQHQHGALADAEVAIWSGTSGLGHVEHQRRDVRVAKRIGQAELLQRAHQRVVRPPCTIRPRSSCRPGSSSLRPCSTM
jgi:hypothetical protein